MMMTEMVRMFFPDSLIADRLPGDGNKLLLWTPPGPWCPSSSWGGFLSSSGGGGGGGLRQVLDVHLLPQEVSFPHQDADDDVPLMYTSYQQNSRNVQITYITQTPVKAFCEKILTSIESRETQMWQFCIVGNETWCVEKRWFWLLYRFVWLGMRLERLELRWRIIGKT